MGYVYVWSVAPPLWAVPLNSRALITVCQCVLYIPQGAPTPPPPPPPRAGLR